MGNNGGIGGIWNSFTSGLTTFVKTLPFIPSGTPLIGGIASTAKSLKTVIPYPDFDDADNVDDIDEFDNTTTTSISISRIMERKVFGIPIVPLMLGGVVLSFLFRRGK